MPEWLTWLGAVSSIVSLVIAVGAIAWALLSPNIRAYFTVKWEYRQMRQGERDIFKAIMTSRTTVLIRKDIEMSQFIQSAPKENGPRVERSHLNISGTYWAGLENLVREGYLRKRDEEDGIEYVLTSLGEQFIERFKDKLNSHKFAGTFHDAVQDAKVNRLSTQIILGTVHTAIGAPPLGDVDDPYSSHIACIPPKERESGVIAIACIIGKELPVKEGDMVLVQFNEVPHHIHTFQQPRWTGIDFFQEGDKHVPTGNFTVRNIHSREDGITELSLSSRRIMRPGI